MRTKDRDIPVEKRLYDIKCIEDGTIMGRHYSGRPRTVEEVDKMVDRLNSHNEFHYQKVRVI